MAILTTNYYNDVFKRSRGKKRRNWRVGNSLFGLPFNLRTLSLHKKLDMVVSAFHPSTENMGWVDPSNMLSTQPCLLGELQRKKQGSWQLRSDTDILTSDLHTCVYSHVHALSLYSHKRRKPELHGKRACNRDYHCPTLFLIPTKHYRPEAQGYGTSITNE